MIIVNTTFAADVKLLSENPNKVYRGDIIKFKVETTLSMNELEKYQNKRVDDLLYILSITKKNNDIIAEAIIAEKGLKEKVEKPLDQFTVYNLDFVATKKKSIKDFILMDSGEKSTKSMINILLIIIFLLLLIISPLIFKLIKKKKEKKIKWKKWKLNQNVIEIELRDTRDRKDLENIYKKRIEIDEYFYFDKESKTNFVNLINKIQFKKDWSGEELASALAKYKSFYSSIEVKNGI
jgi:hypothetical protein